MTTRNRNASWPSGRPTGFFSPPTTFGVTRHISPVGFAGSVRSSTHLYVVRIPGADETRRNAVIERMAALGVATNVHYKPLPMMTAYRALGADIAAFPNAFAYYRNLLSLPLNTLLSDDDVSFVCESLESALAANPAAGGVP